MSTQSLTDNFVVLQAINNDTPILLPSAAVAEIVDYIEPILNREGLADWYLGDISWRGIHIPLIALETLNNGQAFARPTAGKIAVMHTRQIHDEIAYWAFVSAATPRMYRIDKQRLQSSDLSVDDHHVAAMWTLLDGEKNLILDFEAIETALLTLV